jgi:hypothetical protein
MSAMFKVTGLMFGLSINTCSAYLMGYSVKEDQIRYNNLKKNENIN